LLLDPTSSVDNSFTSPIILEHFDFFYMNSFMNDTSTSDRNLKDFNLSTDVGKEHYGFNKNGFLKFWVKGMQRGCKSKNKTRIKTQRPLEAKQSSWDFSRMAYGLVE
jgi:hypothetical protein